MGLDIRLPIGLLFVSLGGLLIVYGVISKAEIYERSLGININLWWGLVMLAFGVIMSLLGWLSPPARRAPTEPMPGERPRGH
jgi:hypothetical protein